MAADCGSTVHILDHDAHGAAVCVQPEGHDGPHGNARLRWPRLEQRYGQPLDTWPEPERVPAAVPKHPQLDAEAERITAQLRMDERVRRGGWNGTQP